MAEAAAAVLDDAWVEGLVAASAALETAGDGSAVVAFTIGKKQKAILSIVDGRVVGTGDEDAVAVTIPVTGNQLTALSDGSESFARSYMMGDLKPVGSTGALLAVVELFENPTSSLSSRQSNGISSDGLGRGRGQTGERRRG